MFGQSPKGERLTAFIAEERQDYRARLEKEIAKQASEWMTARGNSAEKEGPSVDAPSTMHSAAMEKRKDGPMHGKDSCSADQSASEDAPSSGIYSPSRNSDHSKEPG